MNSNPFAEGEADTGAIGLDPELTQMTPAGIGNVEPNPLEGEEEQASPEEQQAYEDLMLRAMGMIHDTKKVGKGGGSVADSIIKALSTPQMPAHVVVGGTAALVLRTVHEQAKRNQVVYPPDAIREVGMDVVVELMDVAKITGAIPSIPEEEDPKYEQFLQLSVLEATKGFGQYLMDTKQVDQQEHQRYLAEEMEREATSGELDDWNMEEMGTALNPLLEQYRRA